MKRWKKEPIGSFFYFSNTAGLLLDFEQLWYFMTLPQSKKWKQDAFVRAWYGALARLGFRVKICHPNRARAANRHGVPANGVPDLQRR